MINTPNMSEISNNNTLTHKIDYKIDLDCSSISVSNMSNSTANMNANQEQSSNSQKIENKVSNILIDKNNLKNTQYIVYKMEDLQLNDEITFTYTTKKEIIEGNIIKINKMTPKYINSYKKEYMSEIKKKIEIECEEVADDINNEVIDMNTMVDVSILDHIEQLKAHGYGLCCVCEKELPLDQMGKNDDDEDICITCYNELEEEQDEDGDEVRCMRCKVLIEKTDKNMNIDGVGYSCDECLKQEEEYFETELQRLQKQKEEIEAKIAEEKYKNEAGQRKEKVIEYLRNTDEERKVELTELINRKEQKLIQMKAELETLQKEKTDAELLGDMNFETIYETINKKNTKKTTAKTDGKKTCESKGDKRVSSKVLNDKERITMTGKWVDTGSFIAEYDKGDDMFYELDINNQRIAGNNFENINRWGNHIYKNHKPEYENKKNMWSVMKVKREGSWVSMLDLPIIE
jgi:hypothetical protein